MTVFFVVFTMAASMAMKKVKGKTRSSATIKGHRGGERSGCDLVVCHVYGSGHKVSHSNIKTNRTFGVNSISIRLYSYALRVYFKFDVKNRTLRTIDKYGGLDAFLEGFRKSKLTPYGLSLRKKVMKAKQSAASDVGTIATGEI